MNQGKLPTKGTLVFDEENTYDFDSNAFKIQGKSSRGNMIDDTTINSNIDNEKMNLRLKLSELPDFDGKQDSWLNFRASLSHRKISGHRKHTK